MANTFKNAYLDVLSSNTAIIQHSSIHNFLVISLRITNVDGSSADTIIADVIDGTSGDGGIAYQMNVPVGSSVELAGTSKLVLATGTRFRRLAECIW